MHEITAEAVRASLSYDPLTGEMVWLAPNKYHAEKIGRTAGAPQIANGKSYHVIQFMGKKIKRGRLAYLWMTGSLPPQLIDHINGNSMDDRWANLRSATALENAQNIKGARNKSGLPMGVRRLPSGRYCARITINKSPKTVGTFDTMAQAHAAYQAARIEHFGEFHGL